jgi:hypothetical protein
MSALTGWDISPIATSEYDADGFVGVQFDWDGEPGEAGGPSVELHSTYGFYSKPLDADSEGSCYALKAYEGSRCHAWLSYDPRSVQKLPNIKKGESMQYGPKGNFVRCCDDGRVVMSTSTTPDDPLGANAQNVFLELHPTEGLMFASPWGRLEISPRGCHITTRSGARLDLGGIAGIPAPFSSISSYASLKAAMVKVEGAPVSIGAGAGDALITKTAFLTFMTTAVVPAIAAAAADPGAGTSAAAIAALEAAILTFLGTKDVAGS